MKSWSFSWARAYIFSAAAHLVVLGTATLLWAGVAEEIPRAEYEVDLDMLADSQAGERFPEPLSQAEAVARIEAAAASTPAVSEQIAIPGDITVPPAAVSQVHSGAVGTADAGSAEKGSGTAGGNGAGTESPGAGTGGSVSGAGSGGNGSGEGGVPFDLAGFADAVEANKQYPYQAVKRSLEGSVTMSITLAADGNLAGVEVVGSSGTEILDKAAVKAVQGACPYANPTGSRVHFTTTLHFSLL